MAILYSANIVDCICFIDMISMDVMLVADIGIMKIMCVHLCVEARPVLLKGHVTRTGVHLG